MSYKLIKDHTNINYTEGNTGREYIVIHYTGNKTDTARANANYFRDVDRAASAHYFVDDNEVVEVVAPENTAWAVGIDYGGKLFGKCNNSNSISIEMCSTDGKITEQTRNNAIELTRELMKKYNISIDRVVRHYDVCNKRCPGWCGWIDNGAPLWRQFKYRITHKKITVKKNVAGRERGEVDPVGDSCRRLVTLSKGTTVTHLSDDGAGWSFVKVGEHHVWVVNSRLSDKSLSKYPKITLNKGKTLYRVAKAKTAFDKVLTLFDKTVTLKKDRKFTVICEITAGQYCGYLYLYRLGRYYYAKA